MIEQHNLTLEELKKELLWLGNTKFSAKAKFDLAVKWDDNHMVIDIKGVEEGKLPKKRCMNPLSMAKTLGRIVLTGQTKG